MAFDALASILKRKVPEAEERQEGGFAPAPTMGGAAPTQQPLGQQAQAGTGGAPQSARFANWGTVYGLNKEKAGKMAEGVAGQVSRQAEEAQSRLQAAKDRFGSLLQTGTTKGPVQGAHGTEIVGGEAPTSGFRLPATTGNRDSVASIRNAQLYGGLMGGPVKGGRRDTGSQTGTLLGEASAGPIASDRADYNAAVGELEAKSQAGSAYGGPKDLAGAVGDQEWKDTQEALRKAEEAAKLTTQEGGLAAQMGYVGDPGESGMAALDEAMARTAGGDTWRNLARMYGGLVNKGVDANKAAMGQAKIAERGSEFAADEWQTLLDQYEAENKAKEPGAPEVERPGSEANGGYAFPSDIAGSAAATRAFESLYALGYSASDVQSVWEELTPAEQWALMEGMVEGNTLTTGNVLGSKPAGSGDTNSDYQSALAKLRAKKASKKG